VGSLQSLESTNLDKFSPFVFYSICQAAAVNLWMWKLTKHKISKENPDSLKIMPGYFDVRWRAALLQVILSPRIYRIFLVELMGETGTYLDVLDNINVSFPITMHSCRELQSARGVLKVKFQGHTRIEESEN